MANYIIIKNVRAVNKVYYSTLFDKLIDKIQENRPGLPKKKCFPRIMYNCYKLIIAMI